MENSESVPRAAALPAPRNRPPGARERAFTLVEAMAVVVVIGILATLAVTGYQKYIASAKTGEAVQLLGSIKSAQEAFRAETFRYMDVADLDSGGLENLYPQGGISNIDKRKYAWAGGSPGFMEDNFRTLGVTSNNPVYYGYTCVAGGADDAVPDLYQAASETPDWPAPGGPWYLAQAVADLDGDGSYGVYATSSFTAAIFSHLEGE